MSEKVGTISHVWTVNKKKLRKAVFAVLNVFYEQFPDIFEEYIFEKKKGSTE